MARCVRNAVIAMGLLIAVPAAALLTYDVVVVRPTLPQIEQILVQARPDEAFPSPLIREMIDANAGSPEPMATRLVIGRVYSGLSQGQWHVRGILWRILLPLHFDRARMYGLYSTLAYNGTDHGLGNFARREYGKPLDKLSPSEAATTVAVTHSPSAYLRNRNRLEAHARWLLEKSGHAP